VNRDEHGIPLPPHERDYLERTIETVRQHRSADNCWPSWANIFGDQIEWMWAEQAKLDAALSELQELVAEQAEDDSLWALNLDGSLPISEAYLMQELRRLHVAVEKVLGAT
jgi:hypothetical protein